MNKTLVRNYYDIQDIKFGAQCKIETHCLTISKEELKHQIQADLKAIKDIDFEIVKPGENTRIIHLLDTIQPMYKAKGPGQVYAGFLADPITIGQGETHVLRGFSVMESAELPWEEASASSGLLYPRDAIMDMQGPIAGMTPFSETMNLVLIYHLNPGHASAEYDAEIRAIGLKLSGYLARLSVGLTADDTEIFSIDQINEDLPNVVLVWQCQNQGDYANTFLYGAPINDLVPTILHPNEMLDGCVVSGNYVWPAFKVPTYLHVNHPILLELYKAHGKKINFRGVIFCRSHNPTHWHKQRCANFNIKLAQYLEADGLVMAWEGGGNAAVDGMLTIQAAEKEGIKASTITFEFGGSDGTEGTLLVDDVPEADAIVSGGSIEKKYVLPKVERVVGGNTLRLNKETGGFFPDAKSPIEMEQTIHFYLSGNQAGHSRLFARQY